MGSSLSPDKKKELLDILRKIGFIKDDSSCEIVINFNQGGITSAEITPSKIIKK